jgi:hypothetical protein
MIPKEDMFVQDPQYNLDFPISPPLTSLSTLLSSKTTNLNSGQQAPKRFASMLERIKNPDLINRDLGIDDKGNPMGGKTKGKGKQAAAKSFKGKAAAGHSQAWVGAQGQGGRGHDRGRGSWTGESSRRAVGDSDVELVDGLTEERQQTLTEATINTKCDNGDDVLEVDDGDTGDDVEPGEDSDVQEVGGEEENVRRKWSTSDELLLCNAIAESAATYAKFKLKKTPFCSSVTHLHAWTGAPVFILNP